MVFLYGADQDGIGIFHFGWSPYNASNACKLVFFNVDTFKADPTSGMNKPVSSLDRFKQGSINYVPRCCLCCIVTCPLLIVDSVLLVFIATEMGLLLGSHVSPIPYYTTCPHTKSASTFFCLFLSSLMSAILSLLCVVYNLYILTHCRSSVCVREREVFQTLYLID